ncbi:hypothetical protein [Streptomyces boncukensis]|uniref:Uncharacterized protein n=1 Tax=Streptomyces boncukensis TaxID=2711219 RepID=A0A6G4X2Q5_9ACTN|nr:hypothetical protein [Streptomyces boncukensis]NGO71826.1 hypothetical protein [Streptomyces boncukensis]
MNSLHGYTVHDIDRLARIAAASAHSGGLDAPTRHDLAWSGIAEALVAAEDTPTRQGLIHVGRNAVHAELAACMHARGYQSGNTTAGSDASPRWATYWRTPPEPNAMDRLVEHLAAVQIGDMFTMSEGRAVEALAVHEEYAQAAEALGLSYKTFAAHIAAARRRFRSHWFAPDTAPPVRGHDKRRGSQEPQTHCGRGHLLDGDNLRIQIRRRGRRERVCRACVRDRSIAAAA